MGRVATWTEVQTRVETWSKRETFEVVERMVADYFARAGQIPVRVELEIIPESAYDDEGGSFTCFSIVSCTVRNAAGEELHAFDLDSQEALEAGSFDDFDLQERLIGHETDLWRYFRTVGDHVVIDLLEPPRSPDPLFTLDDQGFVPTAKEQ
jgi:hypothetical protein